MWRRFRQCQAAEGGVARLARLAATPRAAIRSCDYGTLLSARQPHRPCFRGLVSKGVRGSGGSPLEAGGFRTVTNDRNRPLSQLIGGNAFHSSRSSSGRSVIVPAYRWVRSPCRYWDQPLDSGLQRRTQEKSKCLEFARKFTKRSIG